MTEQNFIQEYQTEYFSLLEEFFEIFTGTTVDEFSSFKDISKKIRMFFLDLMDNMKANKQKMQYVDMLEKKLKDFYKQYQDKIMPVAAELAGNKMLHCGGTSINLPQYNAIKVAALFSDVILLPDSVLPWFAEEKKHEKFKMANILKEVFALLKLKKLTELDYTTPLILVIPLQEEVYEPERIVGPITQAKYEVLVADFFHTFVSREISSFSGAIAYAEKNQEDFLAKADENKLFVPPGHPPGLPLKTAISKFKEDIREKRNKAEADAICGMSDQQLVLEGILESLWPQIHLIENLDRFHCAPLIAIETIGHYACLCSKANRAKLVDSAVLGDETNMFAQTIESHRFEFVTEFSIDSLIEMRKSAAFAELREKMLLAANRLLRCKFYELNKATAERLTEVYETLIGFEKEFGFINEKFKMNITEERLKGPDEVSVNFFVSIAPFILNRLPFGPAKKLFVLKKDELREKQISARSFIGFAGRTV